MSDAVAETDDGLIRTLCDELLILPSRFSSSSFARKMLFSLHYAVYLMQTGLKTSNFVLGEIEFTEKRVGTLLEGRRFDCVVFEYWHAYKSAKLFQGSGEMCVLDMHDILWNTFEKQVDAHPFPAVCKNRRKRLYRLNEKRAWNSFDRIIAINALEQEIVANTVRKGIVVDFLPMGIDTRKWDYKGIAELGQPQRVGFYGALGGQANVSAALRCLDRVMPLVWHKNSSVEFWLVGNNPANILVEKARSDLRIKVTGYVDNIQATLSMMTVIVCPWDGVFGFRSRLIEVMATGVPIVVSKDAIAGMGIDPSVVLVGSTDEELAKLVLSLLQDRELCRETSLNARKQVDDKFSFAITYLRYFSSLHNDITGKTVE
jgi:glycosyltransferase involved in cell wall biosynthesis